MLPSSYCLRRISSYPIHLQRLLLLCPHHRVASSSSSASTTTPTKPPPPTVISGVITSQGVRPIAVRLSEANTSNSTSSSASTRGTKYFHDLVIDDDRTFTLKWSSSPEPQFPLGTRVRFAFRESRFKEVVDLEILKQTFKKVDDIVGNSSSRGNEGGGGGGGGGGEMPNNKKSSSNGTSKSQQPPQSKGKSKANAVGASSDTSHQKRPTAAAVAEPEVEMIIRNPPPPPHRQGQHSSSSGSPTSSSAASSEVEAIASELLRELVRRSSTTTSSSIPGTTSATTEVPVPIMGLAVATLEAYLRTGNSILPNTNSPSSALESVTVVTPNRYGSRSRSGSGGGVNPIMVVEEATRLKVLPPTTTTEEEDEKKDMILTTSKRVVKPPPKTAASVQGRIVSRRAYTVTLSSGLQRYTHLYTLGSGETFALPWQPTPVLDFVEGTEIAFDVVSATAEKGSSFSGTLPVIDAATLRDVTEAQRSQIYIPPPIGSDRHKLFLSTITTQT